jgi:hypothetical protein
MLDITLRSALVASLQAREVQWSTGILHRAAADPAAPESGDPLFVLSTEGAATDSHIVRQFWDYSRADGAGTPVLWNHDPDVLLGQWHSHAVEGTPGTEGARLVARAGFDMEDPLAAQRAGQVKRRVLRAVSVGWIPGALVRRGSLMESDPLFLPMEEDDCGQPMEGFVMGTAESPNILVEASLTPTPADPRAIAVGRNAGALRQLGGLSRGERVSGVDLGAVLLALRDNAAVKAFVIRHLRELLTGPEGAELVRSILAGSPAPLVGADRPFSDLLGG